MKMMKKPTAKKMVVKKASNGENQKPKKPTPTYKNLRMGVRNQQYLMSGQYKDVTPTAKDSSDYLGGYMQGLKGIKGSPNEGQVQKAGRWEGQNANKPKKKGKVGMKIKKAQPGIIKSMGSSAANAAASSSSTSSSSKPARSGVFGLSAPTNATSRSYVPPAGAKKKQVTKERSDDGNYVTKEKKTTTPQGTKTVQKKRRSGLGFVRNAAYEMSGGAIGQDVPRPKKNGGSIKKSKKK